jgi:chorismate dehydratase
MLDSFGPRNSVETGYSSLIPDRQRAAHERQPAQNDLAGQRRTEKGRATLRVGAVTYLNSKPLIEGLADDWPQASLRLDFPSHLARDLATGGLDLALVPSIEYFRGDDYWIVSDACVAAWGPVLSVKLYSRVPISEIRSLALDEGSRTSATLARILLQLRANVQPRLEPLPLAQRPWSSSADALVVIGDRAMFPPPEPFLVTWDLAEEWRAWTGLPFVFAMWVARTGVPLREAAEKLSAARDRGVAALAEIGRREAPLLGLPPETTIPYLQQNLAFFLGPRERQGLARFYELAVATGLAPAGIACRYSDAA